MSKNTTKTTKKRQPAKSQLPSSSAKKKSTTGPKSRTVTKKKTAAVKSVAKKPISKSKNTSKSSSKTTIKSPRLRQKTKKINFRIPFTLFSISITIKKSKPTKKKKSRSFTKHPQSVLRIKYQLALTKVRKSQIDLSMFLVGAGLFGIIYFGMEILASATPAPVQDLSSTTTVIAPEQSIHKTLAASTAVHLSIPSIGVDTELTSVGKNPDSTIEVPPDYHIAGVYKHAPTPGELGPAIIVGHVDNIRGPGVFWRLSQVQPGNVLTVSRQDGSSAKFRVDAVKSFSQDNFPTDLVYGNIDYAGLRLITCGGNFSVLSQRYSQNTVVFASLITDSITNKKLTLADVQVRSLTPIQHLN